LFNGKQTRAPDAKNMYISLSAIVREKKVIHNVKARITILVKVYP